MATSGRGSAVVGYNVQVAVDTEHHLIITHEATNVGSDQAQLARMAKQTKVSGDAKPKHAGTAVLAVPAGAHAGAALSAAKIKQQ
jgi:hypothetical protein